MKSYLLFASNHLERPVNTANLAFSPATHQPHLPMPCAVSIAHAQSQIGKGRQVIQSASMHIRHYTALQPGLPSARG